MEGADSIRKQQPPGRAAYSGESGILAQRVVLSTEASVSRRHPPWNARPFRGKICSRGIGRRAACRGRLAPLQTPRCRHMGLGMTQKLAIVLAAGKGTRMRTHLPKVLVEVRRRPMIHYVLDALADGGAERTIVVVGYRAELVCEVTAGRQGIEFVQQYEQLGTGHAVMVCRERLAEHDGPVVVVTGDSPMMQADSIAALLADFDRHPAACILGTAHKEDPSGLGRVIRDDQGNFAAIVEEKDATEQQRQITEVNMSYYVFNCHDLLATLDHLRADNSQGEYYLTDCPGVMVAQGKEVRALDVLQPYESLGVNTVEELALVEATLAEAALAEATLAEAEKRTGVGGGSGV